ncbi:MAG TPA: hypothetical protein VGC56_09440 [Allosphingosinicella sp.]|jgi:hypothetical protein
MATAAAGGGERGISIERIFGRAFGTIRANPLATLGIAFLFSAVPSVAINYFVQGQQMQLMTRIGPRGAIAFGLVMIVVSLVISAITQGALVRATVAHSAGRESTLAESASAGLVVIVPLFLTSLLVALGVGFAMILLIVPGIMLYCAWAVASPVVVAERLWPLAAVQRSADLTRGARWKVFGLLLIMLVGYWIISAVVGVITLQMTGGIRGAAAMAASGGFPIGFLVMGGIVQTIVACVWGVVISSLYVDLREWKDGPESANLAEVFA